MRMHTTLTATAALAALTTAPLTPALAQVGSSTDMTGDAPTMEEAQIPFSAEQLQSFADAAMKVIAVRQTYQAQLAETPDQADRQALMQQAQQEMVTAVEATDGITVEAYNEIGLAARDNDALNDRILALLQERATEGG